MSARVLLCSELGSVWQWLRVTCAWAIRIAAPIMFTLLLRLHFVAMERHLPISGRFALHSLYNLLFTQDSRVFQGEIWKRHQIQLLCRSSLTYFNKRLNCHKYEKYVEMFTVFAKFPNYPNYVNYGCEYLKEY